LNNEAEALWPEATSTSWFKRSGKMNNNNNKNTQTYIYTVYILCV